MTTLAHMFALLKADKNEYAALGAYQKSIDLKASTDTKIVFVDRSETTLTEYVLQNVNGAVVFRLKDMSVSFLDPNTDAKVAAKIEAFNDRAIMEQFRATDKQKSADAARKKLGEVMKLHGVTQSRNFKFNADGELVYVPAVCENGTNIF